MKLIDEKDIQELQSGKTGPLIKIFEKNYRYCIQHLNLSTNCSLEDAEDLVMDAIIVLHEKIMLKTYSNDNVQAFILKVATNMWLNQKRKNRKRLTFDPHFVDERFFISEAENMLDDERQKQVDITLHALNKLGGPCEALLRRNLIDRIPLGNLVGEFGYKNKDVMKTTKARCLKKLKLIVSELLRK